MILSSDWLSLTFWLVKKNWWKIEMFIGGKTLIFILVIGATANSLDQHMSDFFGLFDCRSVFDSVKKSYNFGETDLRSDFELISFMF